MKKIILMKFVVAFVILNILPNNAQGQSKTATKSKKEKQQIDFYLKAGAAYAFNHGGMIGYAGATDITTTKFVIERKPTSFSAGGYIALGAGLMLGKHIGVELGLNQWMINKEYSYTQYTYATATSTVSSNYKSVFTTRAAGLVMASPSLVIQNGGEKLNIYSRVGVTVPLTNRIEIQSVHTAASEPTEVVIEELRMRPSIGFNGAVGVSMPIGSKMDLYGEGNVLSLTPYLKEGYITSYRIDGEQYVNSLTENDRHTLYEFSNSSSLPKSTSQPNVRTTEGMSYSNFGIAIGIIFHM